MNHVEVEEESKPAKSVKLKIENESGESKEEDQPDKESSAICENATVNYETF